MKRILFVNDEMVMGGVARILNTLLSQLDPNEYQIDLLLLHKHGELMAEIPSHVNILESSTFFETVDLPLFQIKKKMVIFRKLILLFYMKTGLIKRKISKERKKILDNNYDIEFSAKEGFCTLFVAFGNAKKKINWVQTDYKVRNFSKNHMPLLKKALKYIDVNIASSNVSRDSYKEVFEIDNVITIHNLMNVNKIKSMVNEPIDDIVLDESKINLITVARFHSQKALHRIINACNHSLENGKNHHLYIIGGGELETELVNQTKKMKLTDNITFLGYKTNPYKYINKADLFVMSSIYEGFPTIVIETLISSTPVLTTKVAGVDEQIIKEHHGWIVENNDQLFNHKYEDCLNKELLKDMKIKLDNYSYYNERILNEIKSHF